MIQQFSRVHTLHGFVVGISELSTNIRRGSESGQWSFSDTAPWLEERSAWWDENLVYLGIRKI
jgi:hypothetical protein